VLTASGDRQDVIQARAHPVRIAQRPVDWVRADAADPGVTSEHLDWLEALDPTSGEAYPAPLLGSLNALDPTNSTFPGAASRCSSPALIDGHPGTRGTHSVPFRGGIAGIPLPLPGCVLLSGDRWSACGAVNGARVPADEELLASVAADRPGVGGANFPAIR
jgi:hypothetical protein